MLRSFRPARCRAPRGAPASPRGDQSTPPDARIADRPCVTRQNYAGTMDIRQGPHVVALTERQEPPRVVMPALYRVIGGREWRRRSRSVTAVPSPGPDDGQSWPQAGLLESDTYSDLAVGEPMGEPDGEESKEVLNALCRYEPSSVDRQASSRPHRWRNRFSLGAGGRQRDLHRHWPQPDQTARRSRGDRALHRPWTLTQRHWS